MSCSASSTLLTLEHIPLSFREEMISVVSHILESLCQKNDRLPVQSVSKFHSAHVCGISIKQYLQRIYDFSNCSDSCFVLSLIYIDRIQQFPGFTVCSLDIHRLLLTCLMVASKTTDDCYYSNRIWAKIGGISKREMNSLEVEFLFMTGFSLFVSVDEFNQYNNELRSQALMFRQKHVIHHDDTLMDWSACEMEDDEKTNHSDSSRSPASLDGQQCMRASPPIFTSVHTDHMNSTTPAVHAV